MLFAGSFRENIDVRLEHSDQAIWDALDKMQVSSIIQWTFHCLIEPCCGYRIARRLCTWFAAQTGHTTHDVIVVGRTTSTVVFDSSAVEQCQSVVDGRSDSIDRLEFRQSDSACHSPASWRSHSHHHCSSSQHNYGFWHDFGDGQRNSVGIWFVDQCWFRSAESLSTESFSPPPPRLPILSSIPSQVHHNNCNVAKASLPHCWKRITHKCGSSSAHKTNNKPQLWQATQRSLLHTMSIGGTSSSATWSSSGASGVLRALSAFMRHAWSVVRVNVFTTSTGPSSLMMSSSSSATGSAPGNIYSLKPCDTHDVDERCKCVNDEWCVLLTYVAKVSGPHVGIVDEFCGCCVTTNKQQQTLNQLLFEIYLMLRMINVPFVKHIEHEI